MRVHHLLIQCCNTIETRGHQVRSWRAGVLQSLAPTLITHLKQLIKVLLGILETSRQVCWGKLELNSAGLRPSRIKFDDPCYRQNPPSFILLQVALVEHVISQERLSLIQLGVVPEVAQVFLQEWVRPLVIHCFIIKYLKTEAKHWPCP